MDLALEADRVHHRPDVNLPRGTGSSNPPPSSGESCANLTWGEGAGRRQRGAPVALGVTGEPCPDAPWAPEVFNCSAPDTGNMEVLVRYGTVEQRERWLNPLLAGEIRSAFAMTEPDVASSDATNIDTRIRRDAKEYVINGRKWWTSGALDPRCKIMIVMGQSEPDNPDRYRRQS